MKDKPRSFKNKFLSLTSAGLIGAGLIFGATTSGTFVYSLNCRNEMDKMAVQVKSSDSYLDYIHAKTKEYNDAFNRGDLSYSKYNKVISELHTDEHILTIKDSEVSREITDKYINAYKKHDVVGYSLMAQVGLCVGSFIGASYIYNHLDSDDIKKEM